MEPAAVSEYKPTTFMALLSSAPATIGKQNSAASTKTEQSETAKKKRLFNCYTSPLVELLQGQNHDYYKKIMR